ncbi:Nn.00g106310.m01.CDS01 [Neocucurbitaria sp. VM-36]
MRLSSVTLLAPALLAASASARFLIYADEWHPTRPTNPEDRAGIDHVVLAFAMANATASFQPKVPISTIRSEFPNANVSIAVGGWGDDIGFFDVSKTDATIQQFAADIATMLTNTGADGVDIDWEYPGGNGADYKQVPNSEKTYQIDAYPKVLQAIRAAIGDKLLSIAVPGKKGDMIAFTKQNAPKIWPSVDYINVMSYDLMNRRDNFTKHHTSVAGSEDTIKNYLAIGAPPAKINLGFAYYAKYFTTQGDCGSSPLNCPIVLAEDPVTGKDTLTSGAWTFEKAHMEPVNAAALAVSYDGTCGPEKGTKCSSGCCSQYGNCGTSPEHCSGACQHAFGTGCTDADVAGSWQNAAQNGVTDEEAGGQYYFDAQNNLFWTWDTPELISRKFDEIVRKYKLGGVMAWSLGEDSYDWSHIRQMATELANDGSSALDSYATPAAQTPKVAAPAAEETPGTVAPAAEETPEVEAPAVEETPAVMKGPTTKETPSDATSPQAEEPPAVQAAPSKSEPSVDSSASLSEEAPGHPSLESDPNLPYDVVWVDGTEDGPAGDYSEEAGSPPDYVYYEGEGPDGFDPNDDPSAESVEPEMESMDMSEEPTASAAEAVEPSAEATGSVQPFRSNTEYVQPPAEEPAQPSPEGTQPAAESVQAPEDPAEEDTDATWAQPEDFTSRPAQDGVDGTWARPIDDDSVGASTRQGQYDNADTEISGASCRLRRRRRAKMA